MKRFARLLLVTVGFGVLGFVMSLVPEKNATGAAGAPVNIISSIPLSVTGTVAAQQSGNWNVGITGTPAVNANVTFPAALTGASVPVSVQQSANFKTLSFQPGGYHEVLPDGTFVQSAFAIPQGEQFVIKDVSWVAFCESSPAVSCSASAGDAVVVGFGNGSYFSEAIYANRNGILFAGRSDHLTSGIVVTQLPTPTLINQVSVGEVISGLALQGSLVP